MQLDRISAVLRPRTHWEAVDLGVRLVQRWWWPLARNWLILALPAYLLLQTLFYEQGVLAILLVWWLKPLWERPLLLDLSRRMFGETLRLRELLVLSWREGRAQLFRDLLWRRFNTHRSLDMPAALLERQAGATLRRRQGLLSQRAGTAATALMLVGVHIESLLVFATYALIYLLLPSEIELNLTTLSADTGWALWLSGGLYLVAMAAFAPFYVTCGFCLYLNRRTELEAWDIELGFRQLAQRLTAPLLLVALFGFLVAPDVRAQEDATSLRDDLGQSIEQVLAGEDFHRIRSQRIPVFLKNLRWTPDVDDPPGELPDWFYTLRDVLAHGGELLLWLVALGFLGYLLYRYQIQRDIDGPASEKQKRGLAPQQLFGLDVQADSLPADIPSAVAELWRRGEQRPALALLYRASLTSLIHQHQIPLRDGYTEGDCLRVVQRNLDPTVSRYFARLTHAWQRAAYAHQLPEDAELQRLCSDWAQRFQEPVA